MSESFLTEINGIFVEQWLSKILFRFYDEDVLRSITSFVNEGDYAMLTMYGKIDGFHLCELDKFFNDIVQKGDRLSLSWIHNNCVNFPLHNKWIIFLDTISAGNIEAYNFLVEEVYGQVHSLGICLLHASTTDSNPFIPYIIDKIKDPTQREKMVRKSFNMSLIRKNIKNCKYLIENHGIVVGLSDLNSAVEGESFELFQMLISHSRLFWNIPFVFNKSAQMCNEQICSFLIEKFGTYHVDIKECIQRALLFSDLKTIQFVDEKYTDHSWMQSALVLAVHHKQTKVVKWLLKKNVNQNHHTLIFLLFESQREADRDF